MKKVIMLVAAIVVSTCSFADLQSSSAGKNAVLMNSLNSALKSHQAARPLNKNDMEMVYGGEDVSMRPTLGTHTIAV